MQTLPYYYCLLLAVSAVGTAPTNQQAPTPRVCGSIDIRNTPRLSSVLNSVFNRLECSVVDGDVSIVLVSKVSPAEYPVFANLTEITGYLLVYHADGLDSLGRMFPNLRTIGGQRSICHYSLMVFQNDDLKDIGLPNLERISQGGVRIERNHELCFVDSLNWRKLTVEHRTSIFISENNATCRFEADCALNASAAELTDCELLADNTTTCWNSAECQKASPVEPTTDVITENIRNASIKSTAFLHGSEAASSWLSFEWEDLLSDKLNGRYIITWIPARSKWVPESPHFCNGPAVGGESTTSVRSQDTPMTTEELLRKNYVQARKIRFEASIQNTVFVSRTYVPPRGPSGVTVASNRVNITGLDPFTEYRIKIFVCPSYLRGCRDGKQLYAAFNYQTIPIPDRDVVNVDTITIERPVNETNSRKISWKAPSKPNGRIHSYTLYMEGENGQHPSFRLTVHGEHLLAYVLSNIPQGAWRLTIRTETDAGFSPPSKPFRFNIP